MGFEVIVNGLSFGFYYGETPEQAINKMFIDAGYQGADDDRLENIDYATDGNRIMIHTVRVA